MNVLTGPARKVVPIVFHFGRLGDMVLLTTLLQILRQRYGSACELFAAGPWNEALFAGHPDVHKLWVLRRHTPVALCSRWWQAWWSLRRNRDRPVYVSEDQPRQLRRIRLLLWLAGVRREQCVFLPQSAIDLESHWIDRFARFGAMTPAAFAPPAAADKVPRPALHVFPEDLSAAKSWLAQMGWSSGEVILVQPGNYRTMSAHPERRKVDDKAWPLESWVALLRRLAEARPAAVVLVCGAPREAAMVARIVAATRHERVSSAALPLRPFVGLCRLAHSMVSVDTGPAHVAAVLGVPLTVMYGAQSPKKWLPQGAAGSVVLSVGGPPRSRVSELSIDEVFRCWASTVESRTDQHRVVSSTG